MWLMSQLVFRSDCRAHRMHNDGWQYDGGSSDCAENTDCHGAADGTRDPLETTGTTDLRSKSGLIKFHYRSNMDADPTGGCA